MQGSRPVAAGRRACGSLALVSFWFWAGSAASFAQAPPPPVDQAEGGGTDRQIRIGSAAISGSAWIDGSLRATALPGDDDVPVEVRRGRVGVAGTVGARLGYSVSAELATNPSFRNIFVALRVNDQVSVRVGQANPISALERGTSPLSLELIDRSEVTTTLTSPSDIGVSVFSTRPFRKWLGYALNVTNGAGFNRRDNNAHKDLSGRIALSPVWTRGLLVVVSGSRGEQPEGLRTRAGLGADYKRGPWHLLAEALSQRHDNLAASYGYVAMATYRYRPEAPRTGFTQIDVAARMWALNDRASAAGVPATLVNDEGGEPLTVAGIVTTRELQAGVNYYLTPNIRMMANIVTPFDDRRNANSELRLRLQLQF